MASNERGLGDRSIEEIELLLRKVARGDVPHEGDVLLRANRGWIFGPPIIDIGALRYDGDQAGGDVKTIGQAGPVKFAGSNAVPTASEDIYEEIIELGPGNIIEEDIANGELLFKVGGLFTVSAAVTYAGLTQLSQLDIVLIRAGFHVVVASVQLDLPATNPFAVEVIQLITFFKQGDRVYIQFGRNGGLMFTADIINADFLAFANALDRSL